MENSKQNTAKIKQIVIPCGEKVAVALSRLFWDVSRLKSAIIHDESSRLKTANVNIYFHQKFENLADF